MYLKVILSEDDIIEPETEGTLYLLPTHYMKTDSNSLCVYIQFQCVCERVSTIHFTNFYKTEKL